MIITKTSMYSGITRDREIDVTQEQIDLWDNGVLIQNAMPHLSDDDREFLMTGVTPEEWAQGWPEDDSEYYWHNENEEAPF